MKVRVFQDPHEKKRRGPRKCPWSVEWRENGQRRSKAIGTKAKAEDFATVKRAELIDGSMGIITKKKWGDFVEEYLREEVDASGKRPGTCGLIRTVLNHFTRTANPTWVYLIDSRTLDQYRRKRLKARGQHGQTLSPDTVKKELRHLHAALGVAKRWKYLREVPSLPKVATDKREKVHVEESHFLAMLDAVDVATLPDPAMHRGLPETSSPGDWWQALLVTAWVTGMRVDSILKLRWEDMDFAAGRILSRAGSVKQRADNRPDIGGAMPYLLEIRGADPLLLPWYHNKRTIYTQFHKIQRAAEFDLPCPNTDKAGHVCNGTCHVYGFHAFRYAHARFNHEHPQLQQQMGHASQATTDHYRGWAKRQLAEYEAYLPAALSDGNLATKQRENAGKDSGKPRLRLVGA